MLRSLPLFVSGKQFSLTHSFTYIHTGYLHSRGTTGTHLMLFFQLQPATHCRQRTTDHHGTTFSLFFCWGDFFVTTNYDHVSPFPPTTTMSGYCDNNNYRFSRHPISCSLLLSPIFLLPLLLLLLLLFSVPNASHSVYAAWAAAAAAQALAFGGPHPGAAAAAAAVQANSNPLSSTSNGGPTGGSPFSWPSSFNAESLLNAAAVAAASSSPSDPHPAGSASGKMKSLHTTSSANSNSGDSGKAQVYLLLFNSHTHTEKLK